MKSNFSRSDENSFGAILQNLHNQVKRVAGQFMVLAMWAIFMSINALPLHAQSGLSSTISASASVLTHAEIELIPMQDLVIDKSLARDGIIRVSPQDVASAGVLMVRGRPGANARVTFDPQMRLVNADGVGVMVVQLNLRGFASNNQQASNPLEALTGVVQFNDQGAFYIWIGGDIDIRNSHPGSYAGEMVIEIEYI